MQLSGLKIGLVDGVILSPKAKGDDFLKVILKIEKKYQEYIRRDSKATIETQGLLGDKFIFITPGNPKVAVLENGETITTGEGISISVVMAQGKKTMKSIESATKKLEETLAKLPLSDEDQRSMHKILSNVESSTANVGDITAKVKNGEGTIGALLADPALYNDLRALLGHADRNKLLKSMIRATISEQEKETRQPVSEKH